MKKLLLVPATGLLSLATWADDSNACKGYMLMEKGVTLEYTDYNAKEKVQGSQTCTISDISESAGVITVKMHSVSKDNKGEVVYEGDLVFTCENGEIKMDMTSLLDAKMMEGFKDMEVAIEQNNLIFPSVLTEGQVLSDGLMTTTISNGGMQIMKMTTSVTDRKVEQFESVTTPAGTFECAKISEVIKTDMGMFKSQGKSVSWYSAGIGAVRIESYDDKGNLVNIHVLTKVIR